MRHHFLTCIAKNYEYPTKNSASERLIPNEEAVRMTRNFH